MKKSLIFLAVLVVIGLFVGYQILISLPFGPGKSDFTKNITNGYMLMRTSNHSVFIAPEVWGDGIAMIPSKVLKLNDYEDFVIAERIGLKPRSESENDSYQIPDSSIIDYWILNTEENWVLDKLSKKNFTRKMDSLAIPKTIELVDIYNY